METKICKKCGVLKEIICFEHMSKNSSYRNICKECRNEQRRQKYYLHRDEILAKKRERYYEDPKYKEYRLKSDKNRKEKRINRKMQDIRIKIKEQLKNTLDKSFIRKGLKRQKSYEDLLCCGIDYAIDYLIDGYKKKYGKDLKTNDEVDIDHILSLWSSASQEGVEKLCCYKNLRLLTKKDNHNRKYKINKEEQELIKEFLNFYNNYNKDKK